MEKTRQTSEGSSLLRRDQNLTLVPDSFMKQNAKLTFGPLGFSSDGSSYVALSRTLFQSHAVQNISTTNSRYVYMQEVEPN